jgi:hypothetical protein
VKAGPGSAVAPGVRDLRRAPRSHLQTYPKGSLIGMAETDKYIVRGWKETGGIAES